jgi:hypothetical protein
MADWFTRTKTTRTREWVVPAQEPYGACWNQVQQALDAALHAWLEKHPGTAFAAVPDNAVRVKVTDDEVIICFDEETTGVERQAPRSVGLGRGPGNLSQREFCFPPGQSSPATADAGEGDRA